MDEDFDTIEVSEEEADEWYETMVKPMCEDEGYAWLTDEEFEESLRLGREEREYEENLKLRSSK